MALTWVWVGMVCMALVYGAATGQSAAVGAAASASNSAIGRRCQSRGSPGTVSSSLVDRTT